ncbi:inactive hydroxysteroid dehydrogenase-like protein 1 [Uranotaenia lowii]|uniref:inactive hydroxysteroid dehydrogenase-like protein 1 n=1 Tax=Uranotaenia lowii TaxID=190385 RepID=UPI00247A5A93|nr:inactive hydroxysteroid dehydrogenase-like protein 1 [Uranotaenia lowii]XP_055592185.1 inactive hydroxysteroid dehydrogenase-like protein 1 [Uranotaenia lowii]XP_055592186.1 inactive hydroxysteroid dehydrogenase-like protein 1 [Uranotaenia lowii]
MWLSGATLGLLLVGLVTVLLWLYDNLKSLVQIVTSVLAPYFVPAENKPLAERFGKWAVITGSTDGIGKQYAFQLAARGLNIVLISRTAEKLMAVAAEIEQRHQVKTKWIAADFGQGRPVFEKIRQELAGVPVGILVNNVGTNVDFPDDLDQVSEEKLWDIININIGAATMLTRMVLPEMKQRRQGAIVNISSGSELQPLPYMTVYAASKAYIHNFTLAMQYELEPFGITCQLVSPLFVTTKMNNFSTTVMEGGLFIPDAESYAKSAVFTLGKSKQTTGYWTHGIQYCFMQLAPEWVRIIIGGIMNKRFRKEYYHSQRQVQSSTAKVE